MESTRQRPEGQSEIEHRPRRPVDDKCAVAAEALERLELLALEIILDAHATQPQRDAAAYLRAAAALVSGRMTTLLRGDQ